MALAIAFGLLTLIGLLFVPIIGDTLTAWASFLAAVALVLGVINLLGVHVRRLSSGNLYSGVLVLSVLAVFILALLDVFGLTERAVGTIFELVLFPLEAALAAMLAFFLLFAGFRLLRRQKSWWSLLFIVTAIVLLLVRMPLPSTLSGITSWIDTLITTIFVNAGMRGILIGVALGSVVVALRLLIGWERPYDK